MVLWRETVRDVTELCIKSNVRLFKTPPPYPLFSPLSPSPLPSISTSLPSRPSMLSPFSTLLSFFFSSYVQFGLEMTPVSPPLTTCKRISLYQLHHHHLPLLVTPPPPPPPNLSPSLPIPNPSPYFSLPTMGESPMMTEARALFTCWLASVVSCWMHGKICVRMASTW